jgi:hypothetical protein
MSLGELHINFAEIIVSTESTRMTKGKAKQAIAKVAAPAKKASTAAAAPKEVIKPAAPKVKLAVVAPHASETEQPPPAKNAGGATEPSTEEDPTENYFPRVEWTTEAQSPQLTGRAAEFIEYSNIILANQDFKGFQDLFKYFTDRYELPDERMKQVRHSILENAEQALMEAVAGVLSFKHDPHWGGAYQQGLTKEALSAVVMQRFGSVKAIEDGLQAEMKR